MKIAHVIASISEEASGPSYVVPSLCQAQIELGHDVQLHTLAAPDNAPEWVKTYRQSIPSAPRLGSSAALRHASRDLRDEVDIIHVHGLWMMPNVYPFLGKSPNARRVLTPHGTTMPGALEHHTRRKRLFWRIAQKRALRTDAVHATSEAEAESVRHFGFRSPVFVVPNGIDVDVARPSLPVSDRRTVLYLGRLHPIKGLDLLLRAWADLESRRPDWDLVLAGPPAAGVDRDLVRLSRELRLERVTIRGPIYGDAKYIALGTADVFVLPTRSENFGMTVLEALSQATPVITTTGAPWTGLLDHGCGWWVDTTVDGLRRALDDATSKTPPELRLMGERGRQWSVQSFSWRSIAEKMIDRYQTLVD